MSAVKVAVVGLGKVGLPLSAHLALKGASVIGCDVDEGLVGAVTAGDCPVTGEPGLPEALAAARRAGRFRATTDTAAAVFESDVILVIVPVGIDGEQRTDFRNLDAAAAAVGGGLRRGRLVLLESTVPVGATRNRFGRDLVLGSGLQLGDFDLAFSPERVSSGRVFHDLAAYPKVVGGVSPAAGERAAAFYRGLLDAEVLLLPDAETAEFTKLAESVYRDVNIALANELALAAESLGVDYGVAARAANSQPFSHLHQPGVGVGGHCIPVYPYFLLETSPGQRLVAQSREINDSMAAYAVGRITAALAGAEGDGASGAATGLPASRLGGRTLLILGLAYRGGIKEAALSSTLLLAAALRAEGARVLVHDPLFTDDEVRDRGLDPSPLPPRGRVDACILQAAHPQYAHFDPALLAGCRVFLDGRGAFDRARVEAAGIRYLAIGLGS